jgi:hypothetical protein
VRPAEVESIMISVVVVLRRGADEFEPGFADTYIVRGHKQWLAAPMMLCLPRYVQVL